MEPQINQCIALNIYRKLYVSFSQLGMKKMRQPHGGKENYSLPVDDAGNIPNFDQIDVKLKEDFAFCQ